MAKIIKSNIVIKESTELLMQWWDHGNVASNNQTNMYRQKCPSLAKTIAHSHFSMQLLKNIVQCMSAGCYCAILRCYTIM